MDNLFYMKRDSCKVPAEYQDADRGYLEVLKCEQVFTLGMTGWC